MDKRVEDYLSKHEPHDNRADILINAGLYDKIYMPETDDGYFIPDPEHEYPFKEYDPKTGIVVRFYRKQPIDVTDEEFEKIRKCLPATASKNNYLAVVISITAYVIMVIGFLTGTIAGYELSGFGSDFNISLALMIWGVSAISGISLLWFAEILKLLQSIKNQICNND